MKVIKLNEYTKHLYEVNLDGLGVLEDHLKFQGSAKQKQLGTTYLKGKIFMTINSNDMLRSKINCF